MNQQQSAPSRTQLSDFLIAMALLQKSDSPETFISFTPGFSQVTWKAKFAGNRLNGFPSKASA